MHSNDHWPPRPSPEAVRLAALERVVVALQARLAELEARLAHLSRQQQVPA